MSMIRSARDIFINQSFCGDKLAITAATCLDSNPYRADQMSTFLRAPSYHLRAVSLILGSI